MDLCGEFGNGGRWLPSLPNWKHDGEDPSRLAAWHKVRVRPPVCWEATLKGRERMARPR